MKLLRKERALSELSDSELLEKYRAEKKHIYVGELFQRYSEMVYLVAMKYLRDSDAAKDAVMDIFEMLFPKLLAHSVSNFKAWLYSVTKNHCLVVLRHNKNIVNIEDVQNSENIFMENDVVVNLFDEDVVSPQILEAALNKLKEVQRKCLKLFYLQKMSYKEIAEAEGFTEKQVKSYIQNGKRNMKILLNEYLSGNE